MGLFHSTRRAGTALALVAVASVAAAQQAPPRAPQTSTAAQPVASTFTIFVGGQPVGREDVSVSRTAGGWTVTSSGRIGTPFEIVSREVVARYDPEWLPIDLRIDAVKQGEPYSLRATLQKGTLTTRVEDGSQARPTSNTTVQTDATLLLPDLFFGPMEALAARLRTAARGTVISAYDPPRVGFSVIVGDTSTAKLQTASQLIESRQTDISLVSPGEVALEGSVWADTNGRLLRFSLPGHGIEVIRQDIASVSTRHVPISRPNDERVNIPSNGFSLAGTLSKPTRSMARPAPAVVLVGWSGSVDRDEFVFGVPVLGEIAGALADAGFVTLRYDKRGVGQSGGRLESASLQDLGDDLLAAVKWLANRKDVDAKRVAVIGHGDGGLVALQAAKDKRVAAAVLLATGGLRGSELILEQQRSLLDRSKLTESEKRDKVEFQRRVIEAVLTGKGWAALPPETKQLADNIEYQSMLAGDPGKLLLEVRKPLLILHGELDREVAVVNADRLEALTRKRKSGPPATLAKLAGINHLLTPAVTGDVEEYRMLDSKHVSPVVSETIATWLQSALR